MVLGRVIDDSHARQSCARNNWPPKLTLSEATHHPEEHETPGCVVLKSTNSLVSQCSPKVNELGIINRQNSDRHTCNLVQRLQLRVHPTQSAQPICRVRG